MERKHVLKSQGGFTLIEIIAVLVILGILAAVAVPRFLDLQTTAREKTIAGACGAINSAVHLYFAKELLDGKDAAGAATAACLGSNITVVGDFTFPTTDLCGAEITITHDDYTGVCTVYNPYTAET